MDDLRLVDIAQETFDLLAGVVGDTARIAAATADPAARAVCFGFDLGHCPRIG
ncbi:MAG: hypothetical protein IPL29_13290 [Propionivibrio sp.]|uniref:hypothetical protein n=1 Tax=Propionivibrio sp. TaxID=2212460 RepID=UPI0025D472D1|nr:hypothetical protein [Propionivibrio sp.]MBK8401984.1 hypothetical protein [Propionivibrio sp.]MBL0206680.1 hypothetical protein [Propionivibrio sp.]